MIEYGIFGGVSQTSAKQKRESTVIFIDFSAIKVYHIQPYQFHLFSSNP